MTGIVIVDKPADWTSHDVVAKLRGKFKTKRVGHGGTLDPIATGVLPIFLGRATRAASICENAEKEYIAGLRLGLVTDTQDITGNVITSSTADVSAEDIEAVILGFLGAQKQIPPMYSAVKIGGCKLYDLARSGVEIERPSRDIFISEIELIEGGGSEFLLRIVCSKGTYIRTLLHDIGAELRCGGTLSSLRRTRAGAFAIDMAHTLDEILENAEKTVLPVDSIFAEYPDITLNPIQTQKCKNGASCQLSAPDGKYRAYAPGGEFLALGEVKDGAFKSIKSFFEI